MFLHPGDGWNPFYTGRNGLNQDGVPVQGRLPKGVDAPGGGDRQLFPRYAAGELHCPSKRAGVYHYYLDNIVIRKNDGGIRSVIWQSG